MGLKWLDPRIPDCFTNQKVEHFYYESVPNKTSLLCRQLTQMRSNDKQSQVSSMKVMRPDRRPWSLFLRITQTKTFQPVSRGKIRLWQGGGGSRKCPPSGANPTPNPVRVAFLFITNTTGHDTLDCSPA